MNLKYLAFASILALTPVVASAQNSAAPTPPPKSVNAYVGCLNRLSERAFQSRDRYVGWAGSAASLETRARNVYGLYTIYDPSDCASKVKEANALEPHDAELENAGSAFVKAATELDPLLKEADDYYTQSNYKDDKFAKGKQMHPRLLAAWAAFEKADTDLRARVEKINDERQMAALANLEKTEGRNERFLVEALMLNAKNVIRAVKGNDLKQTDLASLTERLTAYEASVKELEQYLSQHREAKVGSFFVSGAKEYLTSSKELMRRIRDRVPFSEGDRMIMNQPGAGWMIQGSPARLNRDYNQLVERYNRGPSF